MGQCSNTIKLFDAIVLTGFAAYLVSVLRFETIPLCKDAEYLTGELPVQSFMILRKRYFCLGFTRFFEHGVLNSKFKRHGVIPSSSAAYLLCGTSLFAFLAELYLLK